MVNIDSRIHEIGQMVGRGEYFTVNRGRQYGKTTTLHLLAEHLAEQCAIVSVSFEGMEAEAYETADAFCRSIYQLFADAICYDAICGIPDSVYDECMKRSNAVSEKLSMRGLSNFISWMCKEADRKVVLIIDEVDQASSYDIFITFLGMLRKHFLARKKQPVFQSVILAGVYDIKNLKRKIRPDAEHQYNSPWNIASDFNVDMSFSSQDIAGMLAGYEQDYDTGMDISVIAGLLYDYTSGYPFLVSRLCKLMDEALAGKEGFLDRSSVWTRAGVLEAVKMLLAESNTLFDDMVKKLHDFPELKEMFHLILFHGERIVYNIYNPAIDIGQMFGFIKEQGGTVAIANRIFETHLYNLFLSEQMLNSAIYRAADLEKKRFIVDGQLNMELVLERFVESFTEIYSDAEESFLEENGRRFFLLYLKPIINGVGHYYVEARTRDMRRTDVIVDYHGQQFVCELKIWHGDEYHKRGEQQLIGYLDDYHLKTGYMLSFNFNKNKKVGVRKICLDGRTIIEAIV